MAKKCDNDKALALINSQLVTQWIDFMSVRPQSIKTYKNTIRCMFQYFQSNNITRPIRQDVKNWLEYLKSKYKPSTCNLYLSSCKLFFRFLAQENLYPNIADNIKGCKIGHDRKKEALDVEQSRRLIDSISGHTLKAMRDKAIISLMLSAGLRTVEIIRANIEDLRMVDGAVYLYVVGKGRDEKERVLVASQVLENIKTYLKERGVKDGKAPLFASASSRNFGERLTTASISRLVKLQLIEAGLKNEYLTAHSLRHTCATQALLNGESLANVQMILRHQNISTTMIYAHHIDRTKNKGEQTVADALFD